MPTARPAPATTAAALPVDVATIAATCDRALAPTPPPNRAEREDLHALLCGHIRLLLPDAQDVVHALDAGALDREIEQVRITGIGREVERPLAPGPAGAGQVRLLALSCRLLLGYQDRTQ